MQSRWGPDDRGDITSPVLDSETGSSETSSLSEDLQLPAGYYDRTSWTGWLKQQLFALPSSGAWKVQDHDASSLDSY